MKLKRYSQTLLALFMVVGMLLGGCRSTSSSNNKDTSTPKDTSGTDFIVPPVDTSTPPKDTTVIPPKDTTTPKDTTPPKDTSVSDTSFTATTTLAQILADPNLSKDPANQTCQSCTNASCDTYGMASIEAVVTAVNTAGTGFIDFYVTDQSGSGGLMVTMLKSDLDTALGNAGPLQEGDKLQLTGELQEYFCMTRLRINPTQGGFFAKVGTGASPTPKSISSCDDINNEANEGALVKLTGAITVTKLEPIPPDTDKNRGEIEITINGKTCLVNGNRYELWGQAGDAQKPPLNAAYTSITGVITYSFGAFQLLPRKSGDLAENGNPGDTVTPPDTTTQDVSADISTADTVADTSTADVTADTSTSDVTADINTTDTTSNDTSNDATVGCNMISGSPTVWINEINYDSDGTETDEFIELAGPQNLDLTGWKIVLYNGNGDGKYRTITIGNNPLSDVTNDVVAATGNKLDQNPDTGFAFLVIEFQGDHQIQNGEDAIALIDNTGKVVEFLQYGGTPLITAVDGEAIGCTATSIGVSDPNNAGNSVQKNGTGNSYNDFSWSAAAPYTKGMKNTSQTFQ